MINYIVTIDISDALSEVESKHCSQDLGGRRRRVFLNDQRVNEEIKRRSQNTLKQIEMETQVPKIYGM